MAQTGPTGGFAVQEGVNPGSLQLDSMYFDK